MSIDMATQLARNRDAELARQGDKEAFSRLIEDNLKNLYRIAKAILYHEADIEDAVQETIIKAWMQLHKLRDEAYFRTWLIRILINQCNEILRKQKRIRLTDESSVVPEDFSKDSEKFELQDAINRLDQDLRTIILLFYFEDLSLKDISYILKVPEGTVKSRLSRAKNKLCKSLKDGG